MITVEQVKMNYPGADAWQTGDSPELASKLANLIKKGIKKATCGSFASYLHIIRSETGFGECVESSLLQIDQITATAI